MLLRLKGWARRLRRDVVAVWIASRDPRVPWHAKLMAALVAAYALSPIDLVPDFIPVLGYLDDVILVPLGILIVTRLVPAALMAEFREQAGRWAAKPRSAAGAVAIVTMWIGAAALFLWWFWPSRAA